MQQVAIVGVGLIGASFGLALRKAGFAGGICGVSSPAAIESALAMGALTHSATLPEAMAIADLIYLAQPVDRIIQTLKEIGSQVRPGQLVTDAGSTKVEIVHQADRYLPVGSFVGGHPLAGKEKRGAQEADADLFRNRSYVLTPTASGLPDLARDFQQWLGRIGADVVVIAPFEHDATLALTSHLPQLLSTTLAALLAKSCHPEVGQLFGTGLLDMTRLAASPVDLWRSILLTNTVEVNGAIETYITELRRLQQALATPDLEALFKEANRFAREIRE